MADVGNVVELSGSDEEVLLLFVVVALAADFTSSGLDYASVCSRWYSANSVRRASTRADTASAATLPESPVVPAGNGRPLRNTGE